MTQRNIALCIVLTIITCGIYGLYWIVKLNEETQNLTGQQGISGGMLILLSIVTCGIYSLYWYYKLGERIELLHQQHNQPTGSSNILYLILGIFGLSIVSLALAQSELNKILPGNEGTM